MRITNVRRGRIIRVTVIIAVTVPLLYLLAHWTDTPKKAKEFYSAKLAAHRVKDVPTLVEGLGNFEPANVVERTGPGEGGAPYTVPEDQLNAASDSEMEYGMNMVVSDAISLDRSIRDTRLEECKHWKYPFDLPKTSVIIVFHNEGFSVLMRTVHSVINRSPKHVLHEIVLVDDFSDKENLKGDLDKYIKQFDGKVKVVRNKEREGLIRTRSRGAMEASGEVIVYLDGNFIF
jgi:polypeptide N-acetylgalactosaminyltransferase